MTSNNYVCERYEVFLLDIGCNERYLTEQY